MTYITAGEQNPRDFKDVIDGSSEVSVLLKYNSNGSLFYFS